MGLESEELSRLDNRRDTSPDDRLGLQHSVAKAHGNLGTHKRLSPSTTLNANFLANFI